MDSRVGPPAPSIRRMSCSTANSAMCLRGTLMVVSSASIEAAGKTPSMPVTATSSGIRIPFPRRLPITPEAIASDPQTIARGTSPVPIRCWAAWLPPSAVRLVVNLRCDGTGAPSRCAVATNASALLPDDDELCGPVTTARSVYPCSTTWRTISSAAVTSSMPMKSACRSGIRRINCTNGILVWRSLRTIPPSSGCSTVSTMPSTRRAIIASTTLASVSGLSWVWARKTS
jgi:hypothetical protein